MDTTATTSLTETLASLSITWIFGIITALTILRLGLIRVPSPAARIVAEALESGMFAIVLVFLLVQPFFGRAYFIPSPSMAPTLLGKNNHGDRILVNKLLYRFRPPQHDDVMVFIAPPAAMEGNPDFIKRLIGLPGDTLEVRRGEIVIDSTIYGHAELRSALVKTGAFGPDPEDGPDNDICADHHVKFVANGVLADGRLLAPSEVSQLLTGNPTHQVTIRPGQVIRNGRVLAEPYIAEDPDYDLKIFQGKPLKYDPLRREYKLNNEYLPKHTYDLDARQPTGKIPPHRFFMMGDNRNDSNDSTNWGPIEDWRAVGKAQLVFWPLSRFHAIR